MTPTELDELSALEKDATPGPWRLAYVEYSDGQKDYSGISSPKGSDDGCDIIVYQEHTDGPTKSEELIVKTRNALPALIQAARESIRYKKALEFYAEDIEVRVSDKNIKCHGGWVEVNPNEAMRRDRIKYKVGDTHVSHSCIPDESKLRELETRLNDLERIAEEMAECGNHSFNCTNYGNGMEDNCYKCKALTRYRKWKEKK